MKNSNILKIVIIALIFSLSIISAREAHAEQDLSKLSDAQLTIRINYIQAKLDKTELWAQLWHYGWIGLYSTLSIVQGGLTFADRDIHWKEDMIAGSITSFIGLCGKLIFPFEPAVAPGKLRLMPESTTAEKIAKLEEAERLFRLCAEHEYDGWSWIPHLLNFSVNLSAGLIIWLGFNRTWQDFLITFSTGYAVSLLDIFTQPTNAIRDRKDYLRKFHGLPETGMNEEPEFYFSLSPMGFSAGICF